MQLIHPALLITLLCCLGVDFGHHAHHTGYVAGLGLCARHAAQSGRHEEHAVGVGLSLFVAFAGSVEHGDGGAVDDALRSDVHIRAGRHLSVLAHAEGVHALPVVGFRVVGYHHAVGHHHARCAGV